jgi:uncharacterized membrane protein (GlpM family)
MIFSLVNGAINSRYPSSAQSIFIPGPPLPMKQFQSGLFLGDAAFGMEASQIWSIIIIVPLMVFLIALFLVRHYFAGPEAFPTEGDLQGILSFFIILSCIFQFCCNYIIHLEGPATVGCWWVAAITWYSLRLTWVGKTR